LLKLQKQPPPSEQERTDQKEFFEKLMATLYFPQTHTFVNQYHNPDNLHNNPHSHQEHENFINAQQQLIAQNFVKESLCFPLHDAISRRDFSELQGNLCKVSQLPQHLWEQQKRESLFYLTEEEFWTSALLQYGALVDSLDKDGLTPLHWASSMGRPQVAKILIAAGAPLNAIALKGYTPLHFASLCCKTEIVKLLIENGANRNQVDWSGETALDCSEHLPTIEVLKKTSTKIPSLQQLTIRNARRYRLDHDRLPSEVKFQVSAFFLCSL